MTLGTLRVLIREAMNLVANDDGSWTVTAGFLKGWSGYAGFNDAGYKKEGVIAPFQINDQFKPDVIKIHKRAPAGATPNDVIKVLKTEAPVTSKGGIVLIPENDLLNKVAAIAAKKAKNMLGANKVDIVTTVGSSKRLAGAFAEALANEFGARYVGGGLPKTLKPDDLQLTIPPKVKGTPKEQKLLQDFDRARRAIAAGNFSIKRIFKPSDRKLLRGFLTLSNELLDLGAGSEKAMPRVIVADDIVTTGSTLQEAARKLQEEGFTIVALVAAFKEQA